MSDTAKHAYLKAWAVERIKMGMSPDDAIQDALRAWAERERAEREAEQALDRYLAQAELATVLRAQQSAQAPR
jgi:Arc/MetJ-type ribon-helix-helix transcriptional regulator